MAAQPSHLSKTPLASRFAWRELVAFGRGDVRAVAAHAPRRTCPSKATTTHLAASLRSRAVARATSKSRSSVAKRASYRSSAGLNLSPCPIGWAARPIRTHRSNGPPRTQPLEQRSGRGGGVGPDDGEALSKSATNTTARNDQRAPSGPGTHRRERRSQFGTAAGRRPGRRRPEHSGLGYRIGNGYRAAYHASVRRRRQ